MWRIKFRSTLLKNMKRRDITFILLPIIGYMSSTYNSKTEHTLGFAWLFLTFEIVIRYE